MAAIHGDDIIAEGLPEKLNRLDEVLKHLVVVKVLDRIRPGAVEHRRYLERHIAYIEGQGFEWLEDPKLFAAIARNRSKTGAKPQSSPGSKDLGKSDPEALDELEEVEESWAIFDWPGWRDISWARRNSRSDSITRSMVVSREFP